MVGPVPWHFLGYGDIRCLPHAIRLLIWVPPYMEACLLKVTIVLGSLGNIPSLVLWGSYQGASSSIFIIRLCYYTKISWVAESTSYLTKLTSFWNENGQKDNNKRSPMRGNWRDGKMVVSHRDMRKKF